MLWNDTFLVFFPEHEGVIHQGEHYGENLRRFYAGRLPQEEWVHLERYVADGVQRNRLPTRPFVFEHHGRWLKVMAVPDTAGGRVRMWQEVPREQASDQAGVPHMRLAATEYGALLSQAEEGAALLDSQMRILDVNDAFMALYGIQDKAGLLGRAYCTVVKDWWQAAAVTADAAGPAVPSQLDAELGVPVDVPLPDGRWVQVSTHWSVDHEVLYSLHWDISDSKQAELALREAEQRVRSSESRLIEVTDSLLSEKRRADQSEQRLQIAFGNAGIAIVVASPQGVVLDANDAALLLLGHAVSDLRGMLLSRLFEPEVSARLRLVGGAGSAAHLETVFRRADGTVRHCQLIAAGASAIQRPVACTVLYLIDITDKKNSDLARERAMEALRNEALHDVLTGLGNRRYLDAALRDLTSGSHALLYIDLDGFKAVNDRVGHAYGDTVLRQIADLFRQATRSSDAVARVGGDEFVVVARDCSRAQALVVASKLIASLQGHRFELAGSPYSLGASIGIRLCDNGCGNEPASQLLADADQACYRAKRSGKNQAVVWDAEIA